MPEFMQSVLPIEGILMHHSRNWTCWLAMTLIVSSLPVPAWAETARWDVDPDHSIIEFRVAHMVVSKTSGRFTDYRGFADMDPDTKTFTAIEATINTASNADFFDVQQFPAMTYKMKSYKSVGERYTALGDLTLRGVTKEIALSGTFNGVTTDPWGNRRAGFSAEGKLNRKDFGMVWNKTLDSGGLVVGDEVHIRLEIECIKSKKP
jgi:polyisoprenoid-binding protein YceI